MATALSPDVVVAAGADLVADSVGRHRIERFEAVAVSNAVFSFVLMRAEAERQVRSAGAVTRGLDAAIEFTHLAPLVDHYTTAQFDAHFDFALHAFLAGMLRDHIR